MKLKRNDYIIISIACFFLGIFVMTQFYSGKTYQKVIQPENDEVMALEVAKLTSGNADLRHEVESLSSDLSTYQNASTDNKNAHDQYAKEKEKLNIINGSQSDSGSGVTIKITGNLSAAQLVDLVNAIKNIGGEMIAINGDRLVINTDIAKFKNLNQYEITVLGNGALFKSALERPGGVIQQIQSKDLVVRVFESDNLTIPVSSNIPILKFAKISK